VPHRSGGGLFVSHLRPIAQAKPEVNLRYLPFFDEKFGILLENSVKLMHIGYTHGKGCSLTCC
jgi:hypothetical protein